MEKSICQAVVEDIQCHIVSIESSKQWHFVKGMIHTAFACGAISEIQKMILSREASIILSEMCSADDLDDDDLFSLFVDKS